jgi:hypothetical protein
MTNTEKLLAIDSKISPSCELSNLRMADNVLRDRIEAITTEKRVSTSAKEKFSPSHCLPNKGFGNVVVALWLNAGEGGQALALAASAHGPNSDFDEPRDSNTVVKYQHNSRSVVIVTTTNMVSVISELSVTCLYRILSRPWLNNSK